MTEHTPRQPTSRPRPAAFHTTSRLSTGRRAFLGGAGAVALATLAGCLGRGVVGGLDTQRVSESTASSLPATEVRDVRVDNSVGDVSVRAVDTDTVDVAFLKRSRDGQRGLDAITTRTELRDDGVLVVSTAVPDHDWTAESVPTVDVTVTLPTGPAAPTLSAVETVLGDIDVRDTRGDARLTTELGSIRAIRIEGFLTLRSEAGDIAVSDVTGIDGASTDLGRLTLDLLGMRGDVDVDTDLGEIDLRVADDLDLDLDAAGSAVDSDLLLFDRRAGVGRLSGRLNAGGRRLRVSSNLGSVSVRSLRRD